MSRGNNKDVIERGFNRGAAPGIRPTRKTPEEILKEAERNYEQMVSERAAAAASFREEHGDFALANTSGPRTGGAGVYGWGPALGTTVTKDEDEKPGIPFFAI